jgi:mono/diheme cytochrome c family protein
VGGGTPARNVQTTLVPAGGAAIVEMTVQVPGRFLLGEHSVSCHGSTGKGNGRAAMALSPKPADWTSKKVQDETDGEIFWKITTGRGAMPSWKHLPEHDRWVLVQHMRSLKK